jgi:mRNA-degrading endonuclease toxin of MazEF toxin-antitoxin module
MRRGELWARGDRDAYVIIANDSLHHARLPLTLAVPLTPDKPTTVGPPYAVRLPPKATGLKVPVWARLIAGATAIPVADLDRRLGQLTDKALTELDDALKQILGLT